MNNDESVPSAENTENVLAKVRKNVWTVDAENGPYKTIQQAIDASEDGGTIKIPPGLYNENIIITKGNLKIEPKDRFGDIIVVGASRPVFRINLEPHDKCSIIGIKMGHSGVNSELEKFQKGSPEILRGHEEVIYDMKDPYQELVTRFEIEDDMDAGILVSGGKLYLEDCQIALNFIVKAHNSILPAVVINEGADAFLHRCEIKGNSNHLTIGIICRNANIIVRETRIHNHRAGGILVQSEKKNIVKIINCKIDLNEVVGVHFVGEDSTPTLENNRIERNNGPGVKIGIANTAHIIKNVIRFNHEGIVALSCDPHIFKNKIEKNYKNGIFMGTHDKIRCDGLIEKNEIFSNKRNGIQVSGTNNYVRIIGNPGITYNEWAGIRVDQNASCSIIRNMISKNLSQGIVIVETASAHIEKNGISENIKAGIALGGQNSNNTTIIDNKIEFGRCEGIFLINGGECYIFRNVIAENNEGLVCVTSVPHIRGNQIRKNKFNGLMLLKDSRARVMDNKISQNQAVGLYIRDKSHGEVVNNIITDNEVDLVVENKHETLDFISTDNSVDGDMRIPQNFLCNLI